MNFQKKSRSSMISLWKFTQIILSIGFLVGCGRSSPILLETGTMATTLISTRTSTPTSIPKVTLTATSLLPSQTVTPFASATPSPSPTATQEALNLTLWAEWELKRGGESAWSPDSKYIVFSDYDRTYLYDVNTLQQIWQVNQIVWDPTFSPDGNIILSTNVAIELWDADSGQIISPHRDGNAWLYVDFLPDGTLLIGRTWIYGGDDTGVSKIGLAELTNEKSQPLEDIVEYEGTIDAFDVSPDGKLLVTAMARLPEPQSGRRVFIWDLASKIIHCDFMDYYDAAFSPIDNVLAAVESYGKITLFDASNCQPLQTIHEADSVSSFSFSPDGQLIAYAGNPDGVIWINNVPNRELVYQEDGFPESIRQLEFSPDGKFLLILGKEVIQIWEAQRE